MCVCVCSLGPPLKFFHYDFDCFNVELIHNRACLGNYLISSQVQDRSYTVYVTTAMDCTNIKNLKINSIQVMQNLVNFQTPLIFLKSMHWLWRYSIWRKRPFSTLLSKKNTKNGGRIAL